MGSIAKEFKEFALRGSVMDMAIGIIIGGAFGKIVNSLVADIIMPPITLLTNDSKFTEIKWVLREAVTEGEKVIRPEVAMTVGNFIQTLIDFILIAIVLFMIIKGMNRLRRKKEEAPAPAPVESDEVKLLREIRDSLNKK